MTCATSVALGWPVTRMLDDGRSGALTHTNLAALASATSPRATGADNQNSCPDGEPFPGARFQYLAANVVKDKTDRSVLRSVKVTKIAGIKVAFIGMTLEGTAGIVSQDGIRGLTFKDEARTANALVPRL